MADRADDESLKVKQVRNFVVCYIGPKYCVISHSWTCYFIVSYLRAHYDMIQQINTKVMRKTRPD